MPLRYICRTSLWRVELFLDGKASKSMHRNCIEKNHLTATYPYIRAENSFTVVHSAGFVKCLENAVSC